MPVNGSSNTGTKSKRDYLLQHFAVVQGDIDNAIDIMKEVARWCEDTGKNMWHPYELSRERLLRGITAENFCVGKVGNDNAAAMILQWHDPLFWPQVAKDQSGFIHKLCVRRSYGGQGLSQKMVAYAIKECQNKGVRSLRLDTGRDRYPLHTLYESFGFVQVGKTAVGEREYALYEMKITFS
jgi:GNAT superfamily N-acetyltransferase